MRSKEKGRKKVPHGYTKHHRKPKRFGGTKDDENISIVLKTEHKAWNELFDNLSAPHIVRLFMEYYEMFNDQSKLNYEVRQIAFSVLKILNSLQEYGRALSEQELQKIKIVLTQHRLQMRKERAWRLFFGDLSLEECVAKINDIWIDPEYELIVANAHVKKVSVRLRNTVSK